MTLESLFSALHSKGYLLSPLPPTMPPATLGNPWYVRALTGFMGWLGGLLVLGFLGAMLSGLFNNTAAMATIALLLFAGSAAIYHVFSDNDFATQFALAASICGQVLATLAFGKAVGHSIEASDVAWFVAALQVALVLVMPNALHRLLSSLFAVTALYVAAHKGVLLPVIDVTLALAWVLLVRNESAMVVRGWRRLAEPLIAGIGIALLLRPVAQIDLFRSTPWLPFSVYSALAFAFALTLWVGLATTRQSTKLRAAAVLATVVFCALTWQAPGLIASTLVLLIAFASGRRALSAAGILALLAYLSTYYYQLQMTLAEKSLVLTFGGLGLIFMWWLHRQYLSTEAT